MSSKLSRLERAAVIAKLLAGYEKHWEEGAAVIVNAEKLESADIVKAFEAILEADADVQAAKGALAGKLAKEKEVGSENEPVVKAIKQMTLIMFANKPEILADFGLGSTKPRSLTVEEKRQVVEKVRATREARGTKGVRQRAAIHGDATLVPPLNGASPAKGVG